MYGFFYPPPEYAVGMALWRNSDERPFLIKEINKEKGIYWITSGSIVLDETLEKLRKNYTKEEPWTKQKAYAKEHGYVWRDKLPSE